MIRSMFLYRCKILHQHSAAITWMHWSLDKHQCRTIPNLCRHYCRENSDGGDPNFDHKVETSSSNNFKTIEQNSYSTYKHHRTHANAKNEKGYTRKQSDFKGAYDSKPSFKSRQFSKAQVNERNNNFDRPFKKSLRGELDEKEEQLSVDWADTFGTLSSKQDNTNPDDYKIREREDKRETALQEIKQHQPLGTDNRKHVANWYARKIMKFGKYGQIAQAIEVFDEWMIKNDRVKPTDFEFSVLLKLIGQVGYAKKAFQLYNQMRLMGLSAQYAPHIYTSLFNACVNSPYPELQRAQKLRDDMFLAGHQPSYITYQTMIKAFGMKGDIQTAFSLADEAIDRYRVDDNLLHTLLCVCLSDKQTGFRHAIMVWRKCIKMGIQPSLSSYNVLLKTCNDCEIGDQRLVQQLLPGSDAHRHIGGQHRLIGGQTAYTSSHNRKQVEPRTYKQLDAGLSKYVDNIDISSEIKYLDDASFKMNDQLEETVIIADDVTSDSSNVVQVETGSTSSLVQVGDNTNWWEMDVFYPDQSDLTREISNKLTTITNAEVANLPNVLDPTQSFKAVLSVGDIQTRSDRFRMIGGLSGALRYMENQDMKPTIVTFTQLMNAVPAEQEEQVLDEMLCAKILPDIDFFNHFMEKRLKDKRRRDEAYDLVSSIKEYNLVPNMRTFVHIARLCSTHERADQLLQDMEELKVIPNVQIMGCLINGAGRNIWLMRHILIKMEQLDIKPNQIFIEQLEIRIEKQRNYIAEKNLPMGHQICKNYKSFLDYYDNHWVKRMCLHKPELDPFKALKKQNRQKREENT